LASKLRNSSAIASCEGHEIRQLNGDIGAIRLALAYLSPAHAELAGAAPNIEPPLTEAEIAIFNTFDIKEEGSNDN
jgi:hypothetical protein